MKNLPIKLFSLLLFAMVLLTTAGCKKELSNPGSDQVIDNPLELEVSNTFDWKTTRDLTLEVTGADLPVHIRNTLQVKSTDEEKVYLKNQLFMDQDYTLHITIPSYENELLITYGSIRRIVDATPETIYFSFISH